MTVAEDSTRNLGPAGSVHEIH